MPHVWAIRECISGIDRSGRCRRCGEKAYMARECNRDPKCLLCAVKAGQDN